MTPSERDDETPELEEAAAGTPMFHERAAMIPK